MSDNEPMTITEFLEARIAEDGVVTLPPGEADRNDRECAAKRAVVKSYRSCVSAEGEVDVTKEFPVKLVSGGMVRGLEIAVKHLAAVYAEHPDYNTAWAL